jgi:hypothetical protein
VMHTRAMFMSAAWRTMSLSARRVIERIEIEMMSNGGAGESNGRLVVTHDNFIEYGISRACLASAIREASALGFVEKTVQGRGGNAAGREANRFRLTSYKFKEHGVTHYEPTNDWQRIKTMVEAEAIAENARAVPWETKTTRPRRQKSPPPLKNSGSPALKNSAENGHVSALKNSAEAQHCKTVLPIISSTPAVAPTDGIVHLQPKSVIVARPTIDQPQTQPIPATADNVVPIAVGRSRRRK